MIAEFYNYMNSSSLINQGSEYFTTVPGFFGILKGYSINQWGIQSDVIKNDWFFQSFALTRLYDLYRPRLEKGIIVVRNKASILSNISEIDLEGVYNPDKNG